MTECLRVQCYWNTASINKSVGAFLGFGADSKWIKYALDRWFEYDSQSCQTEVVEKNDELICREWIEGQYLYYRFSVRAMKSATRKRGFIVPLFSCVLFSFGMFYSLVRFNWQINDNLFIYVIGIIELISPLLSVIKDKFALNEEKHVIERYDYLKTLSEMAVDDYNSHIVKPDRIFYQYGIKSVSSLSLWLNNGN